MKDFLFNTIQSKHDSANTLQNYEFETQVHQLSMAQENKVWKESPRSKNLSFNNTFARDEELDRILQEVEMLNKYKPSLITEKKRDFSEEAKDSASAKSLPDEELDKIFEDVERRNAELQDLLLALESTQDQGEEQGSRTSSTELRKSTDSLIDELMNQSDYEDCEEENEWVRVSKSAESITGSSESVNEKSTTSKLKTSASEEELNDMLAELLEL